MFMIEYRDVGWWYWVVTAGLLTYGVAGHSTGFMLAIGLTIFQLVHFAIREKSLTAFPGPGAILVPDAVDCFVSGTAAVALLDSCRGDLGAGHLRLLRHGEDCFPVSLESQRTVYRRSC